MKMHYVFVIEFMKTGFLHVRGKSFMGFTIASSEQEAIDNAIAAVSEKREYIGFKIVAYSAQLVPVQVCPYNAGQGAVHIGNFPYPSEGIFIRTDLPNPAPRNFKIEFENLLRKYFSAITDIRWSR